MWEAEDLVPGAGEKELDRNCAASQLFSPAAPASCRNFDPDLAHLAAETASDLEILASYDIVYPEDVPCSNDEGQTTQGGDPARFKKIPPCH